MSNVYITSDWHLGHKNINKFRTEFVSEEQHSELILANYISMISPRDVVWFLGDIVFDYKYLQRVKDLPGIKKLVLGNHDTDAKIDVANLCLVFDDIYGLVSYKKAWLSHAPIHQDELRGRYNIHGHCHFHKIDDRRYINACLEHTGYAPKRYDYMISEVERVV
jgi:calcineurin-like phosphoesterase family protein